MLIKVPVVKVMLTLTGFSMFIHLYHMLHSVNVSVIVLMYTLVTARLSW